MTELRQSRRKDTAAKLRTLDDGMTPRVSLYARLAGVR